MEFNNFCSLESQCSARIESYENEIIPLKFNKQKINSFNFDDFNFTIENQQIENNYVFENQQIENNYVFENHNHVIDISNIVGTDNLLFNNDLSQNVYSQTNSFNINPPPGLTIDVSANQYSQIIDVSANQYSQIIDVSANSFLQQVENNLNNLQNEFVNSHQINIENITNINNILQDLTNEISNNPEQTFNLNAENGLVANNNSEYINHIFSTFNINNNT